MGANTRDAPNLTSLFLSRRRRRRDNPLVKQSPGEAGSVVLGDLLLEAAGVSHATTGALSAQSATVAGAAAHPHVATGALASQGATLSGSALHPHVTSGGLVAGSATIAGTAERSSAASCDVRVSWCEFDPSAESCDVRVSWCEFDPDSAACDVRVSWCEFDPSATTCDVRVSWCEFDPQARPAEENTFGGAYFGRRKRLYFPTREELEREYDAISREMPQEVVKAAQDVIKRASLPRPEPDDLNRAEADFRAFLARLQIQWAEDYARALLIEYELALLEQEEAQILWLLFEM